MPSGTQPRRPRVAVWALAFVVALVVGGVAGAVIAKSTNANTSTGTSSPAACDVAAVAEKQLASVVTIMAGGGTAGGVGSGEVIRADGYILTNNHVIAPAVAAGGLDVVFDNGSSARATIVGRDPRTDLAVIRVSGQSNLQTIPIGDSSTLRIGQPVVALGAPLGLSSTVTSGIVSALGRTVNVPGEGSQTALLIDAVQTDAAINPGNSGGALVNCNGALIGIPTAGASTGESGGSIGLGFAIPVNLATKVADEIISTGAVSHAFIGVQAQPLAMSATGQGGAAEGLWITSVVSGSPAATAGLQPGDIITSIDGRPAASADQLTALTLSKRAGDRVELGYTRGGQ